MAAGGDVETAAKPPPAAPGRLRRPQLFLIFGVLSFVWLGALVYMMHGLHDGGVRLEEQMDFAGADIDSLYGIETAVQCRAACEEHPRCLAFTYVKTEKACWLKGEGYSAKSNPNTISGSINETLASVRLSALNQSHDHRQPHRRHWWGGDEGEDGDDAPVDAAGLREEGDDSEGGLEDGSDYTGLPDDLSIGRSPVVLTDEDIERYNDSTTFLGDVRLLLDVSVPVECEEHCLAHGRCVAWTLHKERHLCLLRLVNTSALRYAADAVGGRLTRAQIAERARRLERAKAQRAGDERAREQRRAERRAAAEAARAKRRDAKKARRSGANASAAGGSSAAAGVAGSNSSSSSSAQSSGGNSTSTSNSNSTTTPGAAGGAEEADAGADEEADDDEEGLEMHSELDELEDELDGAAADGDAAWQPSASDDADALERVYEGAGLLAPELDEDAAHVFDDADLLGGDVHEVGGVHTLLECRAACQAYVAPPAGPPCRAWTLSKESGRCWLKSSTVTRQPVSKAAGLISGVLQGSGVPRTDSNVLDLSRALPGSPSAEQLEQVLRVAEELASRVKTNATVRAGRGNATGTGVVVR